MIKRPPLRWTAFGMTRGSLQTDLMGENLAEQPVIKTKCVIPILQIETTKSVPQKPLSQAWVWGVDAKRLLFEWAECRAILQNCSKNNPMVGASLR